jgi:hypothetical protein
LAERLGAVVTYQTAAAHRRYRRSGHGHRRRLRPGPLWTASGPGHRRRRSACCRRYCRRGAFPHRTVTSRMRWGLHETDRRRTAPTSPRPAHPVRGPARRCEARHLPPGRAAAHVQRMGLIEGAQVPADGPVLIGGEEHPHPDGGNVELRGEHPAGDGRCIVDYDIGSVGGEPRRENGQCRPRLPAGIPIGSGRGRPLGPAVEGWDPRRWEEWRGRAPPSRPRPERARPARRPSRS